MVYRKGLSAAVDVHVDPEAAARQLLAKAIEAGGRDNITVLVVRFDPVTP